MRILYVYRRASSSSALQGCWDCTVHCSSLLPSPSQPCYPLTLLSTQMPGLGRDKPSLENSYQYLGRTPPSLISLLSPSSHTQPSLVFPLRIPVCKATEETHKLVSCSSHPPTSPLSPASSLTVWPAKQLPGAPGETTSSLLGTLEKQHSSLFRHLPLPNSALLSLERKW